MKIELKNMFLSILIFVSIIWIWLFFMSFFHNPFNDYNMYRISPPLNLDSEVDENEFSLIDVYEWTISQDTHVLISEKHRNNFRVVSTIGNITDDDWENLNIVISKNFNEANNESSVEYNQSPKVLINEKNNDFEMYRNDQFFKPSFKSGLIYGQYSINPNKDNNFFSDAEFIQEVDDSYIASGNVLILVKEDMSSNFLDDLTGKSYFVTPLLVPLNVKNLIGLFSLNMSSFSFLIAIFALILSYFYQVSQFLNKKKRNLIIYRYFGMNSAYLFKLIGKSLSEKIISLLLATIIAFVFSTFNYEIVSLTKYYLFIFPLLIVIIVISALYEFYFVKKLWRNISKT